MSLPGSWRRYGTPSTSTSSPKLSAIACKSSRNTSRTASPLMVNASTSRSPKLPPDSTARSVRRTFAIAFFTSGLASSFVRSTIAMGVLRRRLVLQPLRRGNLLINSPGYASFHRSDIDPGPPGVELAITELAPTPQAGWHGSRRDSRGRRDRGVELVLEECPKGGVAGNVGGDVRGRDGCRVCGVADVHLDRRGIITRIVRIVDEERDVRGVVEVIPVGEHAMTMPKHRDLCCIIRGPDPHPTH